MTPEPKAPTPPRPRWAWGRIGVTVGMIAVFVGMIALIYSARNTPRPVVPPIGPMADTFSTPRGVALNVYDPRSCQPCHAAIYDEWLSSQHRSSRTDPGMEQFSAVGLFNPQAPECVRCHLPMPVLELPRPPLGEPWPIPPSRHAREEDGVDCAACHVRDGRIVGSGSSARRLGAGPAPTDIASCDPVRDPFLSTAELCAPCHQSYRNDTMHAYDEWLSNPAPIETKQTCQSCHMAPTDGAPFLGSPRPQHFSHAFPGGHDPTFVASAISVAMRADLAENAIIVTMQNLGTGHMFPTGYKIRRVAIEIDVYADDGRRVGHNDFILQKPSRWGGHDGFQLADGVTQEFTIPFFNELPTPGEAHLRVLYRLWPRDPGALIAEIRLPLE